MSLTMFRIPDGVIADISSDPVTVAFPQYGNKVPQREISYTWEIYTNADGDTLKVSLMCEHTPGRYGAYLSNDLHRGLSGGRVSRGGELFNFLDVARYSQPTFEEFARRALELLRLSTGCPIVDAFLRGDPSSRRV